MAIKSEVITSNAYSEKVKNIWEKVLAPPRFGDDQPNAPVVSPTNIPIDDSAPAPPVGEMVSPSAEMSSLLSAIRAGLDIYEVFNYIDFPKNEFI